MTHRDQAGAALSAPCAAPHLIPPRGAGLRLAGLALALGLSLALAWIDPAPAADIVRVHVDTDAKLSPTQARQQALERALPEAVLREALRLVPVAPPAERVEALRAHLAPQALRFVASYQEIQPAPPAAEAQDNASAQPAAPAKAADQPASFDLDVAVERQALRAELTRLGFLAGGKHPGSYVLKLGSGVKEKDALAFAPGSALLGLARAAKPAPTGPAVGVPAAGVEVTVERLPQGYFKAVLRQGDIVVAEDGPTLPALWLNLWGRYFADARLQPGPGRQVLAISGFSSVDAVQDFLRLLAGWDDALRDPMLEGLDMGADGVSARIGCRVVDEKGLDARLAPALVERKLRRVEATEAAPR